MQDQCLATLDCDSWIKRGSACVCMCVKVRRLIEWNQNEKCLRWPGNKEPNVVVLGFGVFFFHFPLSCREVQLCRESIYLFHAGINSDVHLFLPKSELETNTVGGLFVCSRRRNSLQYQSFEKSGGNQ